MSAVKKIDSFRGKYFFLSNFFPAPVIYGGLTYQNNEAAFQAQKTQDQNLRITFTSLAPSDAKRRGRHVQLRKDWESVKDGIMEEIVRAKFTQNQELKAQLLKGIIIIFCFIYLVQKNKARIFVGLVWGKTILEKY